MAEPTVLGAMRRHWLLVSLIVVACVDLALAYGALKQDEFRATATVSAPRPAGSALQSDAQYLDSQVLLLNSRQVGDQALQIARTTPAGEGIDRAELAPTIGKVEIIPPTTDSSGSYGTTLVTIEFTAPNAREAQAGVNALATAYDEVRTQEIEDNAAARLRGIDRAISTADSPSDLAALRKERVSALIDQGRDLGQKASISAAELPDTSTTSGLIRLGGVGLCLGLVLGAAAAFVRAVRLKDVGEQRVADRLYGGSLLCERQPPEPSTGAGRLTEPDRLMGRAVAQRLRTRRGPVVLAVVATPYNGSRRGTTANLALALAENHEMVLAVDGDDGTMADLLAADAGSVESAKPRPGRSPRVSPLAASLSVIDLSGADAAEWDPVRGSSARDHVVVVDCPPLAASARAVDVLSRCTAVVVLVRADEPVPEHVELARWLELTGIDVLGYVFTPYRRRRPRDWWSRRHHHRHQERGAASTPPVQVRPSTKAPRPPGTAAAPPKTGPAPPFPGAPAQLRGSSGS
jgi:Mrp family chromosome partitioning ATPase